MMRPSDKKNKISFMALMLGIFVLGADFLTKYLTQQNIPLGYRSAYPYGGIGIFKDFFGIEFSIVHAINKGAAWGMFADFQSYLIGFRILLILGLIIYLLFYNRNKNVIIPLALIVFGACGNILDYFFYGHVVDMFHFVFWGYSFPVFNVADSAICIGIFWLLIATSFDKTPVHSNT